MVWLRNLASDLEDGEPQMEMTPYKTVLNRDVPAATIVTSAL